MGENHHSGLAQTAAINDTGVIQLVTEDEIFPTDKGGDNPSVCSVAAVVKQSSFCTLKSGQARFQNLMQGKVSADEPGSTAAAPPSLDCLCCRFYDAGWEESPK
jgi:hypothetical protein